MAYKRKQSSEKQASENQTKEREYLHVTSCKVTRARRFDNGDVFDMVLNGISIYGCRLVDGVNGTFVSFPARKGTDGKWYSNCYAVLDDATIESICTQVAEIIK